MIESTPGVLASLARRVLPLLLATLLCLSPPARAQIGVTPGTLRGVVTDADFDAPLPGVRVDIVETGQSTTTTARGSYAITQVPPGSYTVIFSRPNFRDLFRNAVVVESGLVSELNVLLFGEYTELREFVVKDVVACSTRSARSSSHGRVRATPRRRSTWSPEPRSRTAASR